MVIEKDIIFVISPNLNRKNVAVFLYAWTQLTALKFDTSKVKTLPSFEMKCSQVSLSIYNCIGLKLSNEKKIVPSMTNIGREVY